MMIKYQLIILLFVHLILGILIGQFITTKELFYKINSIISIQSRQAQTQLSLNVSPNVQIINLNKSIKTDFKCMKTKTLLHYFNTTICVHESSKDIYVSKSFRGTSSIWDEEGVTRILQLLIRHPHLDFIDIGANIGSYTMYVAALGRFVLAIDCFAPNLDRIHRAVQLANVANRVVLIQNALFTHSGHYLSLSNDANNIGGQELNLSSQPINNQNIINDPYVVKTIKFDELLPILIARGIRGAIMKIDIESSESFVFQSGSRIFDLLDIPYIQMEWVHVSKYPDRAKVILDFFAQRNYDPKTFSCQLLNLTQTATWPFDLCWVKRNVSNLC